MLAGDRSAGAGPLRADHRALPRDRRAPPDPGAGRGGGGRAERRSGGRLAGVARPSRSQLRGPDALHAGADPPPRPAPGGGALQRSRARRRAFIAAAEAEPLGAMFSVGLCLGLRPGELAGLLWEDVDLDADPTQTRRRCRSPARSSAARTTRCGGTPSPSAPRPRAAPWPFPLSRRLRWRSARRPAGPASAWSSPRPRATRSTPATSTRCLRGSPAVRGSKAASPT